MRSVKVYTVDYRPTEDGDRDIVRERTPDISFYTRDDDEYLTPVMWAAGVIRNAYADVHPSSMPYGGPSTWYAAETYHHPYSAVQTEVTAHLDGFTDDECREVYAELFPKYV